MFSYEITLVSKTAETKTVKANSFAEEGSFMVFRRTSDRYAVFAVKPEAIRRIELIED